MAMVGKNRPTSKFNRMLATQMRSGFTSSQQYTAIGVWFDAQDLPRLATHFYRQALEERNQAMVIVRYLLDNGIPVEIPSVDDVRNDFSAAHEAVEFAMAQERAATKEIVALAQTARAEGNYLGERFLQWFLKVQVEEVAKMSTLLRVIERAGDNLFNVEDFLAREWAGIQKSDPSAPRAAGGHASLGV
jgi:bacterioferritin B